MEPDTLAENLNKYSSGWRGHYVGGTASDLSYLSRRTPFIARIGGNSGHFVIVDAVESQSIKIRDPDDGSASSYAVGEFLKIFSGAVYKP